ncbi:MAG: hypothetical protein J5758_01715 [Abditibacteriota bacterium]|nr:hypothetical protein [Abditibacteriota bacterium]
MKHSCEMVSAVSNGRALWKYVYCLLAVFLLLGSSSLCVSDTLYVPNYDPDVSNLSLALNGGYPFTLFANNRYVNSSDGNINFVVPVNGSIATPYAFDDIDYLKTTSPDGSVVSYSPSYDGIIYSYTEYIFGHPRMSPTTAFPNPGITPGFSGNFQDVPAGKYSLIYKITDESTLYPGYVGDVADVPTEVSANVYVVDLKEQARTVNMKQNDVCRIDLSTIPAAFPHENICYISVAWSMMLPMPGVPAEESDLYTSADCSASSKILPDTLGGVSKKWQVGSAPHYIYYKKADSGSKTIHLRLYVDYNSY